jgi:hypothetical protein
MTSRFAATGRVERSGAKKSRSEEGDDEDVCFD